MKRKVMRMGKSTLLLSLPREWVKQCGIKKGDELDVEIRGKNISVGTESKPQMDKTSIDIKNLDNNTAKWVLGTLYKKGYGEIDIHFDLSQMEVIRDSMQECFLGFILEDSPKKGYCTLKNVSSAIESEFEPSLRRAFRTIHFMGEEIIKKVENNDFKGLPAALAYEKLNNQTTNFCQRILNKRGASDHTSTCFLYNIASQLEKICDCHKKIVHYLLNKNNLTRETLYFYKEVNNYFFNYFQLFYKFNLVGLSRLNIEKNRLNDIGIKLINNVGKTDTYILASLLELISIVQQLSASTIAINKD